MTATTAFVSEGWNRGPGDRQDPSLATMRYLRASSASARIPRPLLTSWQNFLHTGRISLLIVAVNIITCFWWGVERKISCTSLRMSE